MRALSFDSYLFCRFSILILVFALLQTAKAEISGITEVGFLPGNSGNAVFLTHAPGRPNELFIVDQRGVIQIFDLTTGSFNNQPFLDIRNLVDDFGGEQGLLGLAFDPDYASNGYFYVNYTRDPGPGRDRTRIDRFQAISPLTSPTVASSTQSSVLEFEQDFNNHNGGWIGFSPTDGYLYIASGDGGSGNDPNNRAQSRDTRLGKMLRIDVHGDDFPLDSIENFAIPSDNPYLNDGDPNTLGEIWSYGLRNPWRSSFDRITGDLWIGDVGQDEREEINFLPDGTAVANFGWRLREGDIQTPGVGGTEPTDHVPPAYDYPSDGNGLFGGNSVVGGYVYRGPDPEVQGRYFFADTFPAQLWTFDPSDPDGTVQNIESLIDPTGLISTPVSFGEDALGNLYIVDLGGGIFRIDTDALVSGDYNADGAVNNVDYVRWFVDYGSTSELTADGNGDGRIDAIDFTIWRNNLGRTAQDGLGVSVPEPSALFLLALAATLSCQIVARK